MLTYITGNLFESPAQTIVNTVNTVGAMGKGVALQFKKIYPEMFKRYVELCENDELQVGSLFVWRTPHKTILNFPTKEHWRKPSKVEYIEKGLETFVRTYRKSGIHSVAFPPLGCGNGELNFPDTVRPIMERYLGEMSIPVFIYAPRPQSDPPEHRTPSAIKAWLRSDPRVLAFSEVGEDLMECLAHEPELHTLVRGIPFRAALGESQTVRFMTEGRTYTYEWEEIKEAWRELRTFGFLTPRSAHKTRERSVNYLLALFAQLPYVDAIRIADDYHHFTTMPRAGIQLALAGQQERPQQPELAL